MIKECHFAKVQTKRQKQELKLREYFFSLQDWSKEAIYVNSHLKRIVFLSCINIPFHVLRPLLTKLFKNIVFVNGVLPYTAIFDQLYVHTVIPAHGRIYYSSLILHRLYSTDTFKFRTYPIKHTPFSSFSRHKSLRRV